MEARAWLLVVAAGCGGGGATLVDAGPMDATPDVATFDAPSSEDAGPEADVFMPGPHGAFPQDIDLGGSVLSAPVVIPIFYSGDMLESDLESFLPALSTSSYWSTLMTNYGVGPLTVGSSIVLTDTPPMTASIDDVADFVAAKLEAGDAGDGGAWPAPTANNIYFIYYPAGTTLTLGSSVSCGFAGYHSYWHTSTNQTYIFAAQARCPMVQALDVATQNTTHELVEATTDPLLHTYVTIDEAHIIWTQTPGYELADLCEFESLSYQRLVGTSLVARFWSNTQASQGHDPCAPLISAPYYNSVPVLPDMVTIVLGGQPVTTDGVTVPMGQSATVAVQLFSDAPTADWTLSAQDLSASGMELSFQWDDTMGNNGDTRHLTITRQQTDASGGTEFVIYSQQSSSSWHAYFAVAGQ